MIVDHYRVPDEDATTVYNDFPTIELATEFARRWTRDSVEEHRKPGVDREKLRQAWAHFGENARVVGGGYNAGDEIDFFLDHPATAQERNWKEIQLKAKALLLPWKPTVARGQDGRIELWLSDEGTESILEKFGHELEDNFQAALIQRISDLAQSDWDYELMGVRVTLRKERHRGIRLFASDATGEKIVQSVADTFGASHGAAPSSEESV